MLFPLFCCFSLLCGFFRTQEEFESATDHVTDDSKDEAFHVIRVHGDGRCLFRCVAVASSKELQEAKRTILSCPQDKTMVMLEEHLADQLQQDVVCLLKKNKVALNEVTCSMKFLLDDKVGERFRTVEDRINSVETTGYAGYLEILVLAYILNKQFRIFIKQQPIGN